MKRAGILDWLREDDPARLASLYGEADRVRRQRVGDAVHLRGLVEISSHCVRSCAYCGLRAPNRIERYRMTADEIIECAHEAVRLGYGTVVLQAGEDPELTRDWVAALVTRIKRETPLAVTLSLGERTDADLAAWRRAGADRYLVRFETSDPALFRAIHPRHPARSRDRMEMLRALKRMGYEAGSGVMIGIPGQSWESLAGDIEWFARLDLDMIGVGPWIAHPATPLGVAPRAPRGQVPNSEEMVYKVIALARLARPDANIPSTTALATVNRRDGYELGLMRGANVVMPNLTPPQYRALYQIYPDKVCVQESARQCFGSLAGRIRSIGRVPGRGPGGRGSELVPSCL